MNTIRKITFLLITLIAGCYNSYAIEDFTTPMSRSILLLSDNSGIILRENFTSLMIAGQPTAAIAVDRMNILTIGVDNPITVATSAGGDDKVSVSITGTGGLISKIGAGRFNVRVATPSDDCTISVFAN